MNSGRYGRLFACAMQFRQQRCLHLEQIRYQQNTPLPVLALLRSSGQHRTCPLIGVDRKSSADGKAALLTRRDISKIRIRQCSDLLAGRDVL
jgi:hypothetical protein